MLSLISRFRNGGTRADAFADPNVRALAERRPALRVRAPGVQWVDFDDLILLVLRLFREHPDALEACRARYRYVMVDEYQDTNAAQFELVHSLTRESRNLCVVGDDDQSIYGWRGAEVANLLDLEKHFPEVKVIKLEQNYRSTNVILRAANGSSPTIPAAVESSFGPPRGEGRRSCSTASPPTRRRRRRWWRTSNMTASDAGLVGAIRRCCSAPTCSRVLWRPRSGRPGPVSPDRRTKFLRTGARSAIFWPTCGPS